MRVKYAYGYIRVSTHDQEEISPDSQEHLLRDYAAKNNIVILKIFTDLGISGRKANKRPGFQEMIGLAKGDDHPVDLILVWKFSRFARNQEESIVYKSLLKKQHNVDVVSVSEPLSDDPFGSLIERIIEWMDEYYSIRLSGEVYRGMKENALRGAYQARPPLGYKVVEHGKPPVIVPEEAKIVRTIFEKYTNEGMSFFDIARYLNSLGLKTSHGKPFERRSVEYIIQNPSYCGMIRWNRTENSTNRIKDKDEWIVTEGQQPAIISKELFESAQERFKASYREGIDTLEEYKANKAIIQKERESLEQQLKELKKAAHKSDQDPADAMLQKVRSVYDILISNNYTYVQKNEALKQIIDKIIYDRKNDSLKIYFFLYR